MGEADVGLLLKPTGATYGEADVGLLLKTTGATYGGDWFGLTIWNMWYQ